LEKFFCFLFCNEMISSVPITTTTTTPVESEVKDDSMTMKIVIVGGGGVGKSTITIQYLRGMFIEDYDPTIEESYRKDLTIDERNVHVEIFDTAGQEEYGAIRDRYLRSGNGFIIVYAITSKPALGECRHFAQRIRRAKQSDQVSLIMVGNKCDLEHLRKVTTEEGQELAKEYSAIFFETSAKTGKNVEEVFLAAIRQVLQKGITKVKRPKKKLDAKKPHRYGKRVDDDSICSLLWTNGRIQQQQQQQQQKRLAIFEIHRKIYTTKTNKTKQNKTKQKNEQAAKKQTIDRRN